MKKMNVGRNDPCPCGSGKKYKNCCLERTGSGPLPSATGDVLPGLGQLLEGLEFASMEEAQAFAEGLMRERNQASIDGFHGLSPDQMHQLLYFPFTSPPLITIPKRLETQPAAPILTLFNLLEEAIGEQGLKPTAKGNLPRNFCREAAITFRMKEPIRHSNRLGDINKEEDFFELHVTRVVAELAGLIRKYKGRLILSRDCRALLSQEAQTGLYPRLFRSYAERFNWGYADHYPEIPFIQQSFLFTLYLLTRYGDEWRPTAFYEDCFLQAFPMVLDEVEPNPIFTPEQRIRSCYTLRTLVRFAAFFGLATLDPVKTEKPFAPTYRVKKTPLLDNAVLFRLTQ